MLRNLAHLIALSGLAIAGPLLNLLGGNPAFFAAHEMSRWEVVAFGLLIALGPALILGAIEALAGLVSRSARDTLHLAFIAFLASVAALQFVRDVDAPGAVALVVAALIGVAIAALYRSKDGVRTALGYLILAPIFFVVSFLFIGETSSIVLKGDAEAYSTNAESTPPIVLINFDAFPVQDLLGRDGKIDSERYPNIARLAESSTWYVNATTAHENTTLSVPSVLDGNWPKAGSQPIVADHPDNLFTLLGKSYSMNVTEVATNLCPSGLCKRTNESSFGDRAELVLDDSWIVFKHLAYPKRMRAQLPVISDRWRDFGNPDTGAEKAADPDNGLEKGGILKALGGGGRPATYLKAISRIRRGGRPTLNFIHSLLPHEPRQYFEDGRSYQQGADPDPSLDGPESFDVRFLSQQTHQRTLLQIGYTDRLVGRLLDRLEDQGMFDRTLLVITSDHGESFQTKDSPAEAFAPGKLSWRRAVTKANIAEVAPVPLIVKYPGQTKGEIDERWVKTIDILPTIADTLGIDMPFEVDGRSLRDPSYRGLQKVEVGKSDGKRVAVSITTLERGKRVALDRRLRLFGTGSWEKVYELGPRPDLIGRSTSELATTTRAGVRASVQSADEFRDVDPASGVLPAHVRGSIRGDLAEGSALAFALNGRIVATARSFKPVGRFDVEFASLLPPDGFRRGANRLEVFAVDGEQLARIGST